MMIDPYSAMRSFRRPAMARADLGPLLFTIVAMELAFVIGPLLVMAFLSEDATEAYIMGDTAFAVIQQLLTFGIYIAALVALTRKLHDRGFWSIVGPLGATITDFKAVAWSVGVLLAVQTLLPPTIDLGEISTIRPVLPWLMWTPVVIVALIVQTGAEELYFRGYLQQQLACMSENRWIWLGLPSLLFGAGHYMNGFGPADGVLYVIWASCLGLACADLTARTGNIGAALGLHLSNNLFAFMLTGVEGWPSNGLALFLYPYSDPVEQDYSLQALLAPWALFEILIILLMVFVMWLAARIALKR